MADVIDTSAAPYNDRFDATKNRNKVLFRPDRPLQQAELNEVQSIMDNNIRNLGNALFKDGAIQTGMAFSNIDTTNKTITIEDGTIYLAGKIRAFKKQTLHGFTGVGQEKIGVKIVQSVVDYNDDPTLLDQTQNVPSYLSPGADRLVEEVVLTYNDDTAPTIYQFNDGKLFVDPNRPELSVINTVLAQRTYEESGSYQVSGFNMWVEQSQTAGYVDLLIDTGVAYVLGYRISKPTSTRISIAKATSTASVVQESYTYTASVGKITVGSNYVKAVKNVVGRTQSPAGGVKISKGAVDGRDPIPAQYTNIDPTTLTCYAGQTVYRLNTDFKLVTDSGVQYIDWNTGMNGTEPAQGTTYFLSFEYDRVMAEGTDYKVIQTALPNGQPGTTTVIDFSSLAGIKPKDGGLVRLDYDYYLGRMDLVTLDQKGAFKVIPGQPARDGQATPPENKDPLTLIVGTVYLYPNSDIGKAQNTAVQTLTMADLQKMLARLENVEQNQAMLLLEQQATQSEDPLTLRGVFVDAFTDFSKMDPELCSVSLSLDDASMTLPTNTPDNQKLNPAFSAMDSVAHTWGRLVTAPFTEVIEISQPLATSAWNVNPYQVYNKQGVLSLTPKSDNWIDESEITVTNEKHITRRLNKWWRHQKEGDPNGKLSAFNQNLVNNTVLQGGVSWTSPELQHGNKTVNGLMVSTAKSTAESAIMYMRQIEINFTATNLKPNADNLFLTIDGVRVDVTPTGTSLAGSDSGTIRANSKGACTGKFTIPPGIRTGTREVTLQNAENQAITTFTAQGINKVTTDTITLTHVTFNLYDPLAQSFALQEAKVVTSVGVYFGSKSSTDNIIMQIRGLSDGGFPNQTVYAERLLTPDDIKVSDDASVETKIALDDPLMVNAGQSYCIVFITDSSDYTLWAATMGKPLINNPKQLVTSQPYTNGVLFSSSNAVSWTVHQESDLKFNLYTAVFQPTGVIQFDPMTGLDSDGILLLATYLTPANTGCSWEVRVLSQDQANMSIDSVPWEPISNYQEKEPQFLISQAQLRATFTSNRYISPMLVLDDLLFVNFVSETSGDYVTLTIDQSEAPFNTITLSYDVDTPSGTTVTPYYSTDGGQTWKKFVSTPTSTVVTSEFNRLTYVETTNTGSTTSTSLKIKLHLNADNRFVRPRVRRLTVLTKDA